jgi:hypothetical protein
MIDTNTISYHAYATISTSYSNKHNFDLNGADFF